MSIRIVSTLHFSKFLQLMIWFCRFYITTSASVRNATNNVSSCQYHVEDFEILTSALHDGLLFLGRPTNSSDPLLDTAVGSRMAQGEYSFLCICITPNLDESSHIAEISHVFSSAISASSQLA
jgi:hypothetical protein